MVSRALLGTVALAIPTQPRIPAGCNKFENVPNLDTLWHTPTRRGRLYAMRDKPLAITTNMHSLTGKTNCVHHEVMVSLVVAVFYSPE